MEAERIKRYYREHFPAQSLFDWLERLGIARDQDDGQVAGIVRGAAFAEFEFALFKRPTPSSDAVFVIDRHAHFDSADGLRDTLVNTGAERLEIGAHVGGGHAGLARNLLVFDVDADDYDAVWPYYGSVKDRLPDRGILTPQGWDMLVQSMRLLQLFLELNVYTGARSAKYLSVFSGRRGAHLYVLGHFRDELLRRQLQERILSPLLALQTANGAFNFLRQLEATSETRFQREYSIASVLANVMFYTKAALTSVNFWQHQVALNPPQDQLFFRLACSLFEGYPELAMGLVARDKKPQALADFFAELALETSPQEQGRESYRGQWLTLGIVLLAPRVDKNVSTGRSHLLKAPFSVHPNTGMVSTPFDLWQQSATQGWPLEQVVDLRELYGSQLTVRSSALARFLASVAHFEAVTAI
jgi:DNA primase catalytic subunit